MRKMIVLLAALLAGLSLADSASAQQRTYWSESDQAWVTYGAGAVARFFQGTETTRFPREEVSYNGPYGPKTIIVDTAARRLYYIYAPGKAIRYGVGVGRDGFTWSGTNVISRKAEWPGWTPPQEMIEREKANGVILPAYMPGGEDNPLGARALYVGDTLYRIHGTSEPWTIGEAVSSGCIRLTNEDVIDLYDRIAVGTKIVVLE